jgi:hypothetical protein
MLGSFGILCVFSLASAMLNWLLKEIVMENVELNESLWAGYEEWLDRQTLSDWFNQQAEREAYERALEI